MISIVSRRLLFLAAVCSVALVSAAGCGGNDDQTGLGVPSKAAPEAKAHAGEWPAPNGDLANTRVASSKIDASNVSKLGVAWTAPIAVKGTFGGYASTPVIAGGVAYTQDLDSNVAAYDLSTGEQLWEHKYNSPTVGPNGVTIGYGKIYGATAEVAFALDTKSGDEVWRSKKLVRNANEGIDMAPAVYDHTVYVSTVPGNAKSFYKGQRAGRPLGARCRQRRPEMVVCNGARGPVGSPPDQLRRRSVASPGVRHRGPHVRRGGEPGPMAGYKGVSVGQEQARVEPLHEQPPQARPR
jgi:hypothetical protein